jgi:hypothetical protein
MSKFDIATEMNSIITSPGNQSIFARPEPQFAKTAANKEDDKAKAEKEKAKVKAEAEKAKAKAEAEKAKEKAAKEKAKEKAEKEKAKEKADKEKAKAKATKKKAMTKYESCVYSLCKASEILDEAGLGKASALTLLALDNLVKTAAKKKEDGKGKDKKKEEEKKAAEKKKAEDKKAADKKKEEAKKKEDKADAKGLPPWLKKKDDKKDGKKEDKKEDKKEEKGKGYKKAEQFTASDPYQKLKELANKPQQNKPAVPIKYYPGDPLAPLDDHGKADDSCMAEDTDDNKEFEDLMSELDNSSEDGDDWKVLEEPAKDELEDDIDLDDPEIESLVEGLEGADVPEEDLKMLASNKNSLQKLAEELSKDFLA